MQQQCNPPLFFFFFPLPCSRSSLANSKKKIENRKEKQMQKPSSSFILFFLSLIFVFFISYVQCVDDNDASVMAILNEAINANGDLNWTDSDACNWKYIVCSDSVYVTSIELGSLSLKGFLPKELVQLKHLETFDCGYNGFFGPVPYMPKSLQWLSIKNNNFNSIPSDFFTGMFYLTDVTVDDNPFNPWVVPSSLQDCAFLRGFSGRNVSFVGKIPSFFGKYGPFHMFTNLVLSSNYLEGELPLSFSWSPIQQLLLNGQQGLNKLNGSIAVLQNMTSLKQIWLHGNLFTGPIPDLSNLDQLFDLSLRDNHLTGVVLPSLIALPALNVVNLTNNYLQGSPPKFQEGVRVDNDMVNGSNRFCTKEVGQLCSPLVNALLSIVEPFGYPKIFADSWKGNHPCARGNDEWLGISCLVDIGDSIYHILTINFHNMSLYGKISPKFAIFRRLHSLVLANNSLSGTIPSEFTRLSQLEELDVSNNQLYGEVPLFSQDVHVKVSGNPLIDMTKSPGSRGFSGDNSGGKGNKHGAGAGVIVGIVAGVVILLGLVALLFVKFGRKHEHGSQVQSPNAIELHPRHSGDGNALNISVAGGGGGGIGAFSPSTSVQNAETDNMVISLQVLRQATDNFSERNILGKGGFGTVYKGELHDGTKIAVKRMKSGIMGEGEKGLSEFNSEIAVLTKVRHRHLVALLGHCLDGSERVLVYEYMSQGPLSTHLFKWKEHEGSRPLDWKRRLLIALDVARGVEYLHSLAQQTFIHRDLKPSNILLGDDMRAKISDFGLVRLAPEGQASFVTNVAGTFGYMSPEYAVSGRVTTKVDVYGYGVILMEMITGRKAVDNSQPEDDVHIVPWFRRMLLNQDSLEKIIDPTIDVDGEALDSFRTVAELAAHCCTTEPYRRPDMSQVVNVLAPLVEIWNPAESSSASTDETDFHITLPEALSRWQALEGRQSGEASSSAMLSTEYNTARDA